MRLPLLLRKLHKWIGLLIGIQVLLWVSGGVVMSFFEIDKVTGRHLVRDQVLVPLDTLGVGFGISDLLTKWEGELVKAVTLKRWLNQTVYEVTTVDQTYLLDSADGKILTPLNKDVIKKVAVNDYSGSASIKESTPLSALSTEIRGHKLPLWKVVFADDIETTLYISPQKGEVVARRNTIWRVYDFFWMLHIMDYDQRTDFNNGLLLTAAGIALFIVLSGLLLLFYAFKRRDWLWVLPKNSKSSSQQL